ncbi:MAG: 7-carboxy-7-deazaguanine synthase, partial [Planctomycetota bacterium]
RAQTVVSPVEDTRRAAGIAGRGLREAPIMEVFASIQGEGLYVGQPQVFLRLAGCPLRCTWCDTPGSWALRAAGVARIMTPEGPLREDAWATPLQALTYIGAVEPREPRTVSITGGEPLLWPDFLLALATMVGERPLHLETAGAHPEALARVADIFDHISLDLKLPQDLGPPVELLGLPESEEFPREAVPTQASEWRNARRACLELIAERDACAKVVVAGGRQIHDYAPLLEDLANLAPEVPLYLQPATPMGGVKAPESEFLEDLLEDARDLGLTVRVVPQVHRFMGIA